MTGNALIVRDLKDHIREHGLRPGDALPSEAYLCEQFSCSRSALREAVRTLVALDIVEVRHGYGTFVAGMSLDPFINALVFRTVLNAADSVDALWQVIDARELLDHCLGGELIEVFTGRDAEELAALVRELGGHGRPGHAFDAAERDFHRALLARARNPLIRELGDAFRRIQAEAQRVLDLTLPVEVGEVSRAHARIVAALSAADPAAYREAVSSHYTPYRRALRELGETYPA